MSRRQTSKAFGKLISILVALILCFPLAQASSTVNPLVGVSKDDVFRYIMYAVYHSSNADAKIRVPVFEASNTDWVRIEITGVNGSVISHTYTLHFKNGSEQNISGQTNVAVYAWSQGNSFRGLPICPANLSVGDVVPSFRFMINATVLKAYPFGVRQANRIKWDTSLDTGECYFDKQTGMLLELNRTHRFIDNVTGEVVSKTDIVQMTSTNLWTTHQFSTVIFCLLTTATASLGVLLYKKRT